MKHRTAIKETSPRYPPMLHQNSAGREAVAVAPPAYGIDVVDRPPTLQPKLTIGPVNDRYEREADRVADQIASGTIQTKCADCAEEERLQRQAEPGISFLNGGFAGSIAAPPAISQQLQRQDAAGTPLPENSRAEMEAVFGTGFNNVRVHTGEPAIQMNRALHARAFTHDSGIYFNRGEYNPGSPRGKHLLAHELTHVVQQRGAGAPRPLPANYIQRAATIDIVGQDFIGPLTTRQRRAALSCPIRLNGLRIGNLHSMGLFYHRSRTGIRAAPAATDNGVGTALHFISDGPQPTCDEFKIIQIITTTHPAAGRDGAGYVDNNNTNTPFYGDVFASGEGEHTISVAGDFQDEGETVDTTHSIYDTPYRGTAGQTKTIQWEAEACVTCVKNSDPDIVLGGVSYGFRIPYNKSSSSFGTIEGIGPSCRMVPSSNFVRVLQTDPTVAGYEFEVELGPGDFPLPNREIRYA